MTPAQFIRQRIREGNGLEGDVLLIYLLEREDRTVNYIEATYDNDVLAKTSGNWYKAYIKQELLTAKLDINTLS